MSENRTELYRNAGIIREALTECSIQNSANAVTICGPLTGHTVRPIAFCESPQVAWLLAQALSEYAPNPMAAVAD